MGHGYVHADLKLYIFCFGKNWNDYTQQTFSASISKKIGKQLGYIYEF